MIRLPHPLSIRIFVVPTALLLVAISLFGYMEYRKDNHNAEIRRVMGSRAYSVIIDFQNSAWDLDQKITSGWTSKVLSPAFITDLSATAKQLLQIAQDLDTYYQEDFMEGEEHIEEMEAIKPVQDQLKSILNLISGLPSTDENQLESLHARLTDMMDAIHRLSLATDKTHQQEVLHVFRQLSHEEKQSAVLILLVLIGSFAFIIALLDAVHHYKSNAERAQAAEKTNAIFAAALQTTHVGVLIRDMRKLERPVVFVNNAFTRITGYSFDDIKGDSSEFLFGWNTDHTSIAAFRRAVSLRESATLEIQLYRKNGSPFWSEWHLSPLLDDEGKAAYFVSLFNDNTVIRQTQEDLIQAKTVAEQASAVKTNFLAMMSHEIRTPINGILGILKLLNDTELDQEQRHYLTIAKTSSTSLHGIINDILDYAKMEAGKVEIFPETFSIREMLKDLSEFCQSLLGDKKIEISSYLADEIPDQLFGDVGRLRQVLLNLISNAIKFTDHGTIQIRVIAMMPQEVNGNPGYLMRFEVQDSGMGISLENQTKLFQEFSQIEKSYSHRGAGTGLGLAISRRLVEMMDGEIGVESQQGNGSKFWFMLPVQKSQSIIEMDKEKLETKFALNDTHRQYTVLLVEDNDTNRLIATRYLEKAGFFCEIACDGLQAIDKAKAKNYDMILMDVSMPVMNGLEATSLIRKMGGHNETIPVIALTAHVMADDRKQCLAAGMNDYLIKPLDYGMLLKITEKWLHVTLQPIAEKNKSVGEPRVRKGTAPTQTPLPMTESQQLSSANAAPVFDERVLQRMKDDLGGEIVEQVTRTFLLDSSGRLEKFKSNRPEDVRDAAHTLKSSSESCGLILFSRLMTDIEMAAQNGNTTKMHRLLPMIENIYAISKTRLEKERQNYIA